VFFMLLSPVIKEPPSRHPLFPSSPDNSPLSEHFKKIPLSPCFPLFFSFPQVNPTLLQARLTSTIFPIMPLGFRRTQIDRTPLPSPAHTQAFEGKKSRFHYLLLPLCFNLQIPFPSLFGYFASNSLSHYFFSSPVCERLRTHLLWPSRAKNDVRECCAPLSWDRKYSFFRRFFTPIQTASLGR